MKRCPIYIRRGTTQRLRVGRVYNQSGARKYLGDRDDNHADTIIVPDKVLPIGTYVVRVDGGYEFYDPAAFREYFRMPLLNVLGRKFKRLPILTKVLLLLLAAYAGATTFWMTALYLIIHNTGR